MGNLALIGASAGSKQLILRDFRLGDLLLEVSLIDRQWLVRGLRLSELTGLPLGRCLVILKCIDPSILKAVLEAQVFIRSNLCSVSNISKALSIMKRNRWTLIDALTSLGVDSHPLRGTRLGELICSVGTISDCDLEFALCVSDLTGIPLGKTMIMLNAVSFRELEYVLAMQKEIRSGRQDRKTAIKDLQGSLEKINRSRSNIEEQLTSIRITDLIISAKILEVPEVYTHSGSDIDILNRAEESEVLSFVSKEELAVLAMKLLEKIWIGGLEIAEASEMLRKIVFYSRELKQGSKGSPACVMSLDTSEEFLFYDLLKVSEYLTKDDTKEIVDRLFNQPAFAQEVIALSEIGSEIVDYFEKLRLSLKKCFEDNDKFFELLKLFRVHDLRTLNSAYVIYNLYADRSISIEQALIFFNLRRLDFKTSS